MNKKVFLVWVLVFGLPLYTVTAEDKVEDLDHMESTSLLTRAKKRVKDINLRNLAELAPFALVAKCYSEAPNLTMAMLGATLIVISLRNQYIQRTVKKQYIGLVSLLKKQKERLSSS